MKILALTRAKATSVVVAGPHAYVSIADSDQDPADLPVGPETLAVLRLHFDDVLDGARQGREIVAFDEGMASSILAFVESLEDRVETLVVHCNGGQCRSPAVAAALSKILTDDDDVWFRTRRPNALVYRTLLEVHHLALDQAHEDVEPDGRTIAPSFQGRRP